MYFTNYYTKSIEILHFKHSYSILHITHLHYIETIYK